MGHTLVEKYAFVFFLINMWLNYRSKPLHITFIANSGNIQMAETLRIGPLNLLLYHDFQQHFLAVCQVACSKATGFYHPQDDHSAILSLWDQSRTRRAAATLGNGCRRALEYASL